MAGAPGTAGRGAPRRKQPQTAIQAGPGFPGNREWRGGLPAVFPGIGPG